jgi:CHAT domain-containing protein
LDRAIQEFKELHHDYGKDRRTAYQKARADLAGRIREPLDKYLPGIKTLIVSPDGGVHRLPFGALPGREEKCWAQELNFAITPSAGTLVRNAAARPNDPTLWLSLGGVNYGREPNQGGPEAFHGIPGSLESAEQLDELFRRRYRDGGTTTLLTGIEASKENLLRSLPGRRFAYVSTHGYFVGEPNSDADPASNAGTDQGIPKSAPAQPRGKRQPFAAFDVSDYLDSALVLANANTVEAGSGLLTAEEIRWQPLDQMEVVALAACETGLAHIRDGQGVIGLADAFLQAGADSVVCALWEVDSRATNRFMEKFFRRIASGEAAAEALRSAQLDLQRSSDFADPYYWAAWQVVGAPGRPDPSLASRREGLVDVDEVRPVAATTESSGDRWWIVGLAVAGLAIACTAIVVARNRRRGRV